MPNTRSPSDLPPLERCIMQAVALHFCPVSRTKLMRSVRLTGIHLANGRTVTQPGFKPVLDQLIESGWLQAGDQGISCAPELLNRCTDDALASDRFDHIAGSILNDGRNRDGWIDSPNHRSYPEALRNLRLALFQHDVVSCNEVLNDIYAYYPDEVTAENPLDAVDSRGFEAPWFVALPDEMRGQMLLTLAQEGVQQMQLRPGLLQALMETNWQDPESAKSAHYRIVEYGLLAGMDTLLEPLLAGDDSAEALNLRAWAALISGDLTAAGELYELAWQALKKGTRKRNIGFSDLAGAFWFLPLLIAGDLSTIRARAVLAGKDKHNRLNCIAPLLIRLVDVRRGSPPDLQGITIPREHYQGTIHLLMLQVIYWIDPQLSSHGTEVLKIIIERAENGGFEWVAGQARALLARTRGDEPEADVAIPLVDLLTRKDAWEYTLEALAAIGDGDDPATTTASSDHGPNERLVWWLQLHHDLLEIQPRIQKRTKQGRWTKGRVVALERLSRRLLEFADADDQRISATIEVDQEPWSWGQDSYEFVPERSWPALVGHPRLFRADDPAVPLELVAGEPELHVHRENERLRVELQPPLPLTGLPVSIHEETRSRWRVVQFNDAQRHIGALIEGGLECPAAAEERLRQTLGQVAPLVNIHSDIGGDTQLPQVPADPRIHLALTPLGDGLTAEMLMRPLGTDGPGYPPGSGGAELTAAGADGERRRVCRDLGDERQRADTLIAACPVLAETAVDACRWELPEPYDCLELLEQLQAFGVAADSADAEPTPHDHQAEPAQPGEQPEVVLEWPQGQKLRLAGHADGSAMSMALHQRGEWFEASGELVIDEQQVMDLQRLLALVASSGDRFLPLGDGRFLALTDSFRRRLQDLDQLSDSGTRKPRFHPLTAPLLEDIGADLGDFSTDQAWQQRVARLQAGEQQPAAIPSTLSAELRDYQVDGYHWLMRLAGWGVGACLADDMGLGKTVQALALLIERAPQGPSLVLAPTSVANNWLTETRRFAPTLKPILFGPGDRQAQIDALGPFDLLIASYGLMQTEIERFAAREDWNCLVLDEAQAIKNPATRRSKAVFRLQADFRIATTGTPIENHLGELWSLFRFLNPGLLGSLQAFNKRYAGPIERDNDQQARDRLRRLVRPFILRRLKSAVLDELPPRTEIVLQVEPGPDEVAFYEALRRQAVEKLEGGGASADDNQRFQVLAAITRLRRAACNPALVAPEAGIASAKLALFLETVEELREGRHKALVFSQFVDHLSLVRAALDERGISYQYLDGATPAGARAKRVQAFQAGDGDLFLISLKAGGTGLNLTAADYVIHLDPWWNPAVEDQASDRAHRIGQQRPVTVYRLVAKGSIEERIIKLHARKRGLADGLLEGGDAAARLDTSEMLELMRDTGSD